MLQHCIIFHKNKEKTLKNTEKKKNGKLFYIETNICVYLQTNIVDGFGIPTPNKAHSLLEVLSKLY